MTAKQNKYHKINLYVSAVIGVSALTLASVVGIVALRPEQEVMPLVVVVIGITSPAMVAFIGLAVKEVYLSTNSRLTELVELTAKSSYAEGRSSKRVVDNFMSEDTEK